MQRLQPGPNIVQEILQASIPFIGGFGPTLLFPAPSAPGLMQPAVTIFMTTLNMKSGYIFSHLLGHSSPLNFMRASGKGSLPLGALRETGKFAASFVPGMVIGVGVSAAYQATYPTISAVLGETQSVALAAVCANHWVSLSAIGVFSFASTSLAKMGLEKLFSTGEEGENTGPNLGQYIVGTVMRPLSGVTLFEVARLIMLDAGVEGVLRNPNITILAVVIDQMMLGLNYMSFMPNPISSLVPEEVEEVNEVAEHYSTVLNLPGDEEQALLPARNAIATEPTTKQKMTAVAKYSLRAAFVMAAGGYLINLGLSTVWSEDKEEKSRSERMGYNAALVAGTVLLEKAIEHAPALLSKVKLALFSSHAKNENIAKIDAAADELLQPDSRLINTGF